MNLTRVDNKKLKQSVDSVVEQLEATATALAKHLPVLTEADRKGLPRPRADFPKAARSLATETAAHPAIVGATEYEAEAVVEDLNNVEVLDRLAAPLARIQQMVDDARLQWLAEAYVPSLELYGVAKVGAKKNGALALAIAPLAEVFSTPRKRTQNTK
jgi:hypothetical protein